MAASVGGGVPPLPVPSADKLPSVELPPGFLDEEPAATAPIEVEDDSPLMTQFKAELNCGF